MNLDPSKRPTLDEIMDHSFLKQNKNIPEVLPLSTLACPPSVHFMQKYCDGRVSIKSTFIHSLCRSTNEQLKLQKQLSLEGNDSTYRIIFYVDFSAKYGLAYLLSNGCFGCFFNDKTNLCVNPVTKYKHNLLKEILLCEFKQRRVFLQRYQYF